MSNVKRKTNLINKRLSNQSSGMRLKAARNKLGLSQREFGERLGLKWHQIKDMEAGKLLIRPETALKIEKTFSINLRWLLTGEGEMFIGKEGAGERSSLFAKLIPVIQQHVPEGFPEVELRDKYIVGYIYLPDVPEGAMAVKVKDDSMSPIIEYGEYVVFLVEDKNGIRNGDIVVALNEWNEIVIRRYKEKEREVYLISDNPKYPILKPDQECKIVGKVVRKLSVREV